ncbi:hypothetical protein H072_9006 [Dactylellina haptotyla CBS 200.50]|uniref:Uncharacterized protein n=1 Tax=Dactylellina haptotyla (strain CBS 200.50) TaxID=1284197 RepID=S8A2X0_DACHA|nr:hypothetical protein H072_9006 [Dactylellina haptotyla CBS 200.50]
MAAQKHPASLLNIDDDIALHLLIETAIFDSSSYDILSHEEVDQLKREETTLNGRIEALKRKLLLETKVRDAAQSLSRLQSPKHVESSLNSPTSFLTGGFNKSAFDHTTLASTELGSSIAKCNAIDSDIRKLESDLWRLQRRLLRHTSRVLASAQSINKPRSQRSSSTTAAANSFQAIAGKPSKNQFARPPVPEEFDDRSFYRPSNGLNGSPIQSQESLSNCVSGASQRIRYTENSKSESLDGVSRDIGVNILEKRLKGLNSKLDSLLIEMGCAPPMKKSAQANLVAISMGSEEEGSQKSTSDTPNSSDSLFEKQIACLELGLAQIQSSVLDQPANRYSANDPKQFDKEQKTLSLLWETLNYYESSLENETPSGDSGEAILQDLLSAAVSENTPRADIHERSVERLGQKVKSLVERSLRLAKDKGELAEKLHQVSVQIQLDADAYEVTKSGQEQQIVGLTNSLSHTMNELSQMSSKQDAISLNLKQEISKLQSELDSKDSRYQRQLEELEDRLSIQKTEFEDRFEVFSKTSLNNEHHLQEKVRMMDEELNRSNRALEDSLLTLKNKEKENQEQQENMNSLRTEMSRSEVVASAEESQRLLDRKIVDDLDRKLQVQKTRILELEDDIKLKEIQIFEYKSNNERLAVWAEEYKTTDVAQKSRISNLEGEIERLIRESEKLRIRLEDEEASSQRQIEEIRNQAAATLQAEKGKTQSAMDTSLLLELEILSKQNEELLKANVALQAKLSEASGTKTGESEADHQILKDNCDRLQKELADMLLDYEKLMKASVNFEAERVRLEAQVDTLQDKIEGLESNLADEKIRLLGNGSPIKTASTQSNSIPTPISSTGEAMTMSVLRAEFKKMMRDMRSEHSKALKGEQEARRRVESELRQYRKEYPQSQKQFVQ